MVTYLWSPTYGHLQSPKVTYSHLKSPKGALPRGSCKGLSQGVLKKFRLFQLLLLMPFLNNHSPQLLQRSAFPTASLHASPRFSGETGRQKTRQNTKHKLQKRDIDAYELSYAQLGHKKDPFRYDTNFDRPYQFLRSMRC